MEKDQVHYLSAPYFASARYYTQLNDTWLGVVLSSFTTDGPGLDLGVLFFDSLVDIRSISCLQFEFQHFAHDNLSFRHSAARH